MGEMAKGSSKLLKLDDVKVGQKFKSETYTVTTEEIKTFAKSYDPQYFHLDEEAAHNSFFGELVASGWNTAAITMKLVVSATPIFGGVIGAGGEINWPRPTKPGDVLHVEGEVLEVRPSKSRPDRGIITVRTVTYNQKGEEVQTFISKLVAFKG